MKKDWEKPLISSLEIKNTKISMADAWCVQKGRIFVNRNDKKCNYPSLAVEKEYGNIINHCPAWTDDLNESGMHGDSGYCLLMGGY